MEKLRQGSSIPASVLVDDLWKCYDAAKDWLAHQKFLENSQMMYQGETPRSQCPGGPEGWELWRQQFVHSEGEDMSRLENELRRVYDQRKLTADEYARLRRLYCLDAQTRPTSSDTGQVAVLQKPSRPTARFCPMCAADLSDRHDALHCPSCGADLRAQPSAATRETVAGTAGYCQSCGASLRPGSGFCGSCGSPAKPTEPTRTVETPVPAYCMECGAQLKPGSSFCGKCGTSIPR